MTYDQWATKWGVPAYAGGVGDGWVPLLETLATELAALGFDFSTVTQIKEKYGGLRFYYDGITDAVDAAVERAETAALRTCEECGAPGRRRSGGWILALCDACAVTRGKT